MELGWQVRQSGFRQFIGVQITSPFAVELERNPRGHACMQANADKL